MITDDILNGLYDSDIEKWKLIFKTNNLYAVSTLGRIMSMRDGRIMKTTITNKGYELVITHVDGKPKGYTMYEDFNEQEQNFDENENNLEQFNEQAQEPELYDDGALNEGNKLQNALQSFQNYKNKNNYMNKMNMNMNMGDTGM